MLPPLPWAEVYRTYSGPSGADARMSRLWTEPGRSLELLDSLRELLDAWIRVARSSFDELTRLLTAQRTLAIVAGLDGHVLLLEPDVDPAARLGRELRRLREELTSLARR
uniref:Uncharacterized protein n=1 Tax=Coccolithus braarudii TaxID=221442 RepID=A0A7S0LE57_9EUKA